MFNQLTRKFMEIKFTNNFFFCKKKILQLIMRIFILLFCTTVFSFSSSDIFSQNAKIIIDKDKTVTVDEVFDILRSQTEYTFIYQEDLFRNAPKVHLKKGTIRANKLLKKSLSSGDFNFDFTKNNKIVLIEKPEIIVKEEQLQITGIVTTKVDGIPLPGVNVVIQGTVTGTQTDFDGKYSLTASAGDILNFSYIGMKSVQVTIGTSNIVNVQMEEDSEMLNEIVVTALGIKKEAKKLGYSIQTVSGDDITKVRSTNVANTLSGRVNGVQINQNGSGVGGSTSVTVRGITSLVPGQNSAMIVVDGVIIDGGSLGQGSFSGGLDYGNGLSDINPDDIQSINVLKGGNATALYGSRGSSGVIVITTKKGTAGKMNVDISTSATFDNVAVSPKLQNEYGQGRFDVPSQQLIYDITRPGSWGPALDGSSRERFDGVGTVPYSANPGDFKDFYRTGSTIINSIGLSGGSDKGTYRLSYSNLFNQPILDGSNYKRQSISLNTTANVTDKLKVQTKIAYVKNNAQNRPDITDGQANTVRALLLKSRNISNADLEANYLKEDGTPNNFGGSTFTMNPYYPAKTKINEDSKNRYTGLISATYDVTNNLAATARYSQDQSNYSASIIKPIGVFDNAPSGELVEITQQNTTSNYDFLLAFNKDVSEKISLSSTVGYSGFESKTKSTRVQANDLLDPSLISINNFTNKNASTLLSRFKSQSLFGSVQFGFNDYAFIEITGRNDWNSTLPKKNISFFYPSVGTSFLLHDIFNIESEKVNSLKLRASWAKTGNATQPYKTRSVYNVSSNPYNGISLFYLGNPDLPPGPAEEGAGPGSIIPNVDLVAELSSEYEFGLDASFFNNRLGFGITYYNKDTKNQILQISLPPTSGAEGKVVNAGLVNNKGIEISLNATPIKAEGFSWNTSFNYSKNENRIERLVEGLPTVILARQFSDNIQLVATEGNIYGDLRGTTFSRDDQGRIMYDSTGLPIVGELGDIGNASPDFLLGINNTFKYKNFELDFLIDVKSGGDVYSFSDLIAGTNGNDVRTLEGRDFYTGGNGILVPSDAVVDGTLDPTVASRGVDPLTLYQRLGQISENWISDASYVKLRQASLTYNFPSSLLDKLSIAKASISYIGRNLAILHKNTRNFDPEVGFNTGIQGIEIYDLPSTSSHGLKLSVSF